MAILEVLPGIEVTVESQGRALPEYEDDSEWANNRKFDIGADRRSSKYVECKSDTEFRIALSIKPPFELDSEYLTFCVYIDGQQVSDKSLKSRNNGVPASGYVTRTFERVNANEVIRRPFKFASIQKVDDADSHRVKNDAKSVPGVGEIIVFAYRSYRQALDGWHLPPIRHLKNAPSEISEKALKGQALSHGVAFGKESREHKVNKYKPVFPDGRRNPIAVYRFKYRSREALQQELIIPRSPSPDIVIGPLNTRTANDNHLSRDERLAKLQREMDLIKSEVKEEGHEAPLSGKKRAAGEAASGRAYKTSRKSDGSIVVDLTDD